MYDPAYMVDGVIVLDTTEEAATERMMAISDELIEAGHNDEEGHARRYEKWQSNMDDEAECITPFFAQMEVLDVPMEDTENVETCVAKMKMYVGKGKLPFNFHPTAEEQAAAEAKVVLDFY